MNGKLLSGLFILLMGLVCNVANCDDEDDAKKAFDAGKALYSKNDFNGATQKFREAYRIRPTWKLHFNIGQSEVAAKHYGMAVDAFEAYLIEGGDEIPMDRQEEVRKELKRLREMVGTVHVKAPKGASIWVNGNQRGIAPIVGGILVPAGKHRIEARVEDKVISEIEATIRVGSKVNLDLMPDVASQGNVTVGTVEEPTPSGQSTDKSLGTTGTGSDISNSSSHSPAAEKDPGKRLKLAGIITMAVAGAVLIAGGVTGGLALSKEKTLEKECSDGCDGSMAETGSQRDNLALTTNILWGVGAAGVSTGLILFMVGKKRSKYEQAAQLRPVISRGFAGIYFSTNY